MADNRDELREDLMALLAASRELPPAADAELASVFLDHLRKRAPSRSDDDFWLVSRYRASIGFVGAVWLAAAAILGYIPYYYYTHDTDVASGYYSQTVPTVLTVAVVLTLIVCLVNLAHWRLPHVRIVVLPDGADAPGPGR